jgi:ABC-type Zn2+ transport system substrate-binding protein/surface adhesin
VEAVGNFLVSALLTGGARMTWRIKIKVSNSTKVQVLFAEILK